MKAIKSMSAAGPRLVLGFVLCLSVFQDSPARVALGTTGPAASCPINSYMAEAHGGSAVQAAPSDKSPQSAPAATNVQYASFHSDALGKDVAYAVQLPHSYDQQPKRRYPVVYFLHGMFGNEREFERRGVAAEIEKLRTDGTIGDLIIVSPAGGNSFYLNSKAGVRYEDAIVKDLIPYIDKTYRTVANPGGRAIQGISMGGFGALLIAFKHPEMFSSVTTHCAALFTTLPSTTGDDRRSQFVRSLLGTIFGDPPDEDFFQANNPIKLGVADAAAIKKTGLKIYFDCGEQDRYGFQQTNKVLDEQLTQAGVPHEFHLFPGNHGWEYMISVADHSYGFLWKNFNAGKSAGAGK